MGLGVQERVMDLPIKTDDGHYRYFAETAGMQFDESGGTWIQVLPLGEFKHPRYGDLSFDTAKLGRMVTNFQNNVRGIDIALNYNHETDRAKGAKAAGWFKEAEVRDSGLWAYVQFTSEARTEIADGAWRYISAELADRWCDAAPEQHCYDDVLLGAALTNTPFMKNMAPINLSEMIDKIDLAGFDVPAGKYPQDEANYGPAFSSTRRCLNCAYFRDGSCLVVDGSIDPDSVSDYFAPIYASADSMMGMMSEPELMVRREDLMAYRDIPQSVRDKMPAEDFAGKNRSFPIEKPADVAAAAASIGRAGSDNYSTDQLKANIIRIAKRKGAAFVAKLPKAWQGTEKKAAREEVTMDTAKLAEALGLKAEATEEELAARATKLRDYYLQREPEEAKVRKFEEDYPDIAAQMREDRQKLAERDADSALAAWNRQGMPPAINPLVRAFLLGEKTIKLTEDGADVAVTFNEVVDRILKAGIVPLKGGVPDDDEATTFTEPTDQLAKLITEAQKANTSLSYKDARAQVLHENKELAAAVLRQAPRVAGGGE